MHTMSKKYVRVFMKNKLRTKVSTRPHSKVLRAATCFLVLDASGGGCAIPSLEEVVETHGEVCSSRMVSKN